MPYIDSSVSACPALIAFWGLTGLARLLRPMSLGFVGRTLFPLGALCGVAQVLRPRCALRIVVFVGTDAVLHLTVGRNLGRLGVLVQLMLGA